MSEPLAKTLGYAGLIPFVGLAAGLILLPQLPQARLEQALITYAAVILSFLGGIVWGRLLAPDASDFVHTGRHLIFSNVPPLLAWGALFLSFEQACLMLATVFVIAFLYDRGLAAAGLIPDWFFKLRRQLTMIVVIALGAAVLVP